MRYDFNSIIYVDEAELTSLTGWSKKTQQAYRSQRKVPYIKLGAKIWYPLSAVLNVNTSHFEAKQS